MARPYRGKRQRSLSSENMSIKARRRNITAAPAEVSVKPTCFADLAPRGPLKVQNSVVGILRENGDVTLIRRAETIDDYFATLDGFWDAL